MNHKQQETKMMINSEYKEPEKKKEKVLTMKEKFLKLTNKEKLELLNPDCSGELKDIKLWLLNELLYKASLPEGFVRDENNPNKVYFKKGEFNLGLFESEIDIKEMNVEGCESIILGNSQVNVERFILDSKERHLYFKDLKLKAKYFRYYPGERARLNDSKVGIENTLEIKNSDILYSDIYVNDLKMNESSLIQSQVRNLNAMLHMEKSDLSNVNFSLKNIILKLEKVTQFPNCRIIGCESVNNDHMLTITGNDGYLYYDDKILAGELFIGFGNAKAVFISFYHKESGKGYSETFMLDELSDKELSNKLIGIMSKDGYFKNQLIFPSRKKLIEKITKDIKEKYVLHWERRFLEN